MRKLLFVVLLLVIAGFALARRNRMVPDAVLIERWQKNRAAFEELLALTRKEAGSKAGDSREKMALAKRLGISMVAGIEQSGFEFYVDSTGTALGGKDKGYLYCEHPYGTVEQNLDSLSGKKAWVQYLRPIEGNWYIFLLIDD